MPSRSLSPVRRVPVPTAVARSGLDALLRPHAVAVIGASRRPDAVGHRVFRKLLDGGFNGPVYPVNPGARAIASVSAVPSIAALPDGVDLAVIALPAPQVADALRACIRRGIRGAIVLSAGFAETGEKGREAELELRALAREGGLRLVGPNCLGVISTDPNVRLDATFAPVEPLPGRVAMVSQSGALGVAILETARELDLGLSAFVSVGNKADVSGNDLLEEWEHDDRTDLILLYLESFGNPARFARIARRVARRKPILAVKAGRTEAGRRAAGSHTAALAAPDRCVEALLAHTGVLRAATLEEMFDAASLLVNQPLPRGRRVAVLTNAGGPGILCADACESQGLVLPELSDAARASLAACCRNAASVVNPVDLAAPATADDYARALPVLLDDPGVDAVIAIFVSAGIVAPERVAAALRAGRAAARTGRAKPLLTCFLGRRGIPAPLRGADESIPSFRFPESAARALATAVKRADWLAAPEGSIPDLGDVDARTGRAIAQLALVQRGPGWLAPCENENLLSAFGIPHSRSFVCATPEEVAAAAASIGGPVAVKLASTTLVHKSEWRGVELDLRSPRDAQAAAARILRDLERAGKRDELLGIAVQPMARPGLDVIVGVVVDPSFGPLVGFGLGGVATEVIGDVAFRLAPLTDAEAERLVRSIRGHPLLAGWRGAPPADEPALIDLILRVARLAECVPEVRELDLNPVRVFERGAGACTLDARIRVEPAAP